MEHRQQSKNATAVAETRVARPAVSESSSPMPDGYLYRILLVDDEPNVLSALRRALRSKKYEISTAENGLAAIALMQEQSFHLVISDDMMPGMRGSEFLGWVLQNHPDTIRIMLTGQSETSAMMDAVKKGAIYRFIIKPWQDDDLRVTTALALQQQEIIRNNQELQDALTDPKNQMHELTRTKRGHRSKLAGLLREHRLLTDEQLDILKRQNIERNVHPFLLILENGWVKETQIQELFKSELNCRHIELPKIQVDPQATELIPKDFCIQQLVLPLHLNGRRLVLAVADPTDWELHEDLRFHSGLEIDIVLADSDSLQGKIKALYGTDGEGGIQQKSNHVMLKEVHGIDSVDVYLSREKGESIEALLQRQKNPAPTSLVNAIFLDAVVQNASDIHIQPRSSELLVRFRCDGILHDAIKLPVHLGKPLVSRIKILAEMDIAERRRPQDGRITMRIEDKIFDVRISSLPTINGEKLVLRLLDRNAAILGIEELGFSQANLEKILFILAKPQGIVLATGPTGSGKTTTIFSLLQENISQQRNFVTIEDPVEYYLDQATQVPIRENIGLDFATSLRSILRQDPDVIMLGEIRDEESARVAFLAAQTGHMVYSTLHTNSAVETLARLYDLSLPATVIATSLEAVISQRLVRRICPHCREPRAIPEKQLRLLGDCFDQSNRDLFHGRGCTECKQTGYRGRLAVHEVFVPNHEARGLIEQGTNILDIRSATQCDNRDSIITDAIEKAYSGSTTTDEILRVLGPQKIPTLG